MKDVKSREAVQMEDCIRTLEMMPDKISDGKDTLKVQEIAVAPRSKLRVGCE